MAMSGSSLQRWGVSILGTMPAVSGCSADSPSSGNPADNPLPSEEGAAPDTNAPADAASADHLLA